MADNKPKALSLQKNLLTKYWEGKNLSFAKMLEEAKIAEYWTMEITNSTISEALGRLAEALNSPNATKQSLLKEEEDLFLVMAYMPIDMALRLLWFFNERLEFKSGRNEESLARMMIEIALDKKDRVDEDTSRIYALLLYRLIFARNYIELHNIFGEKAIKRLDKIMEGEA